MWAAGGLRRKVPADAAASQLGEASGSTLSLFPGHGAQPSPGPFVKCTQHRWCLAEAEVAAPSNQTDRQSFGDLREALSSKLSFIRGTHEKPRGKAPGFHQMRSVESDQKSRSMWSAPSQVLMLAGPTPAGML